MPWSNEFLQNYTGFQYNIDKAWDFSPFATFSPLFGTPFTDTQTLTLPEYDPVKQSVRRVAIAIPSTVSRSANSFVGGIYTGNLRGNTPRFLVTYQEVFTAFDNSDPEPKQQLGMTFDDVILTNNSTDEWIFRSITLVHCPLDVLTIANPPFNGDLDAAVPELFIFVREADSTLPAAPYVFTASNFSFPIPYRTRFQYAISPFTANSQFLFDLPDGILNTTTLFGSVPVAGAVSAYYLGAFTLAVYSFPQSIILTPGDSITFNLGTIVMNYNAFGRVC